ncbi:MAG TPA: LysM peptidoglycan-binding domain-containing protein [Chloroflexota bacterium]|nr:LysM peptidoglycan-binding domain-containing protein [Chloroflexota bacterium]
MQHLFPDGTTNAVPRMAVFGLSVVLAATVRSGYAAQDSPRLYRVEAGDTLTAISVKTGVPLDQIIFLNEIEDPDVIQLGQVLVLEPRETREYVVAPGDTLTAIAARLRVRVQDIAARNAIADPDVIAIGTALRIPDPSTQDQKAEGQASGVLAKTGVVQSSLSNAGPATRDERPSPVTATARGAHDADAPQLVAKRLMSPNYWPGRPGGGPIAIVLHTAAGTLAGMDRWFGLAESQASAHYGIGIAGEIHQYVDLGDRSWSDGTLEGNNAWPGPSGRAPNDLTVNIETEDLGDLATPVSDAQYRATLAAGRAALDRYPSIRYLVTHRAIAPKQRANDPGPRWVASGRFDALASDLNLRAVR